MLSGDTLSDALTSPVTLGVACGLVVGKFVGVSLATFIAVKTGVADLPRATSWIDVFGLAAMAGRVKGQVTGCVTACYSSSNSDGGNPPLLTGPQRVGEMTMAHLPCSRIAWRYSSQSGCSPEIER